MSHSVSVAPQGFSGSLLLQRRWPFTNHVAVSVKYLHTTDVLTANCHATVVPSTLHLVHGPAQTTEQNMGQ